MSLTPSWRSLGAAVSVALALSLGSAAARADALSIVPTQASLTFLPELISALSLGPSSGVTASLLGDATFVDGVFKAPVDSITVSGQGPGPIHVNFQSAAGVQLSDGLGVSLTLSRLAFDVGTQYLTADVSFTLPFLCEPLPGAACPALAGQTVAFNDLILLKAQSVSGHIDGGMPLDQALAVPTLLAQRVSLTAPLALDLTGLRTIAAQLGVVLPDDPLAAIPVATLTVSAVPEVSSMLYLAVGVAGVGILARRRQVA